MNNSWSHSVFSRCPSAELNKRLSYADNTSFCTDRKFDISKSRFKGDFAETSCYSAYETDHMNFITMRINKIDLRFHFVNTITFCTLFVLIYKLGFWTIDKYIFGKCVARKITQKGGKCRTLVHSAVVCGSLPLTAINAFSKHRRTTHRQRPESTVVSESAVVP